MRFPPIKLDFFKVLTDDTGMLQHAKYATPYKKEGYTTDDNARALIACTKHYTRLQDPEAKRLVDIYLGFVFYMQRTDGKMHNLLSYDRRFMDEVGSEDCLGRTLWACGTCVNSNLPQETKLMSKEVFDKSFAWALSLSSPRAKALSMMGLYHYHKAYPDDANAVLNMKALADQLVKQFTQESSSEWTWFEPYLTYVNGRLPHALFLAYECTGEKRYVQVAEASMSFLVNVQTMKETFVPIGNHGWYRKDAERAIYDQQSIEASCMTEAALAAFRVTKKQAYQKAALMAFEWFLGRNLKGVKVYDGETGSCYDGITPEGVNLNSGAESTVAYLQARLSLEELLSATEP